MSKTKDILTVMRDKLFPGGSSRYGVVIGIEKHRDERLNLGCSGTDALAMYDLMVDPACGMFPPDNVTLLLDEDATRDNIRRELALLRRKLGKNDTFWLYYSGHAAPEDGEFYWVTHDADVDDLFTNGLSQPEISQMLDKFRCERTVIFLDCCHAQAMAVQANKSKGAVTAEELFNSYTGTGRVTLASSGRDEKSLEVSGESHGVFTKFLLRGLRGDADIENRGVILLDSLWKYLNDKVSEAAGQYGNTQKPVRIGEVTHDLPLTLNPEACAHKKQIADKIKSLVGLDEDNLTTHEAELCLELLKRPAANAGEAGIIAELDSLVSGQLKISTFKRLLLPNVRNTVPNPIRSSSPSSLPPRKKKSPSIIWWLDEDKQIPESELIALIKNGNLTSSSEVWREGLPDWIELKELPDFNKHFPSRPLPPSCSQKPSTPNHKNGDIMTVPDLGLEMVYVEPGSFMMGAKDSSTKLPVHQVTFKKEFWISKFPVTQNQYQEVMKHNPSFFKGESLPVECVSFGNVQDFCKKLNQNTTYSGCLPPSFGFCLPTEAQWEFAARGGTGSVGYVYSGSDSLDSVAWYDGNSNFVTQEVGKKAPNELGLYDMSGNIWEWSQDAWHYSYNGAPSDGSFWGNGCSSRVCRGGSWLTQVEFCKVSSRIRNSIYNACKNIGFRIVISEVI